MNHKDVALTKVDKSMYLGDFVEITFQDQYLGRCDMWRVSTMLNDQCIYVGQEINFLGSPAGVISGIYIRGSKVYTISVCKLGSQ